MLGRDVDSPTVALPSSRAGRVAVIRQSLEAVIKAESLKQQSMQGGVATTKARLQSGHKGQVA